MSGKLRIPSNSLHQRLPNLPNRNITPPTTPPLLTNTNTNNRRRRILLKSPPAPSKLPQPLLTLSKHAHNVLAILIRRDLHRDIRFGRVIQHSSWFFRVKVEVVFGFPV